MLVAVGVGIVQIVQGVYNQSNTISKLETENKNWPERLDKGLKEVSEEKQEIIDAMKAEKQELVTKTEADQIRIDELIKANEELSKKNEESIRKSDEMISRMDAILGIPGIQASVQMWQEAGQMYLSNMSRSNHSEFPSEPSTVKTSEEEVDCTETASVAESEESDIEIIDHMPPSTSMNGLTLSSSASNQR